MYKYSVLIYDITDIKNKKLKQEIEIEALDKSCAIDHAHTNAEKKYKNLTLK